MSYIIGKCINAVFKEVDFNQHSTDPLGGGRVGYVTERRAVECGGDIMTKDGEEFDQHSMDPIEAYCNECNTAYFYPYGAPD